MKPYNLLGRKFGHLIVVGPAERRRNKTTWNCLCICGTQKSVCTPELLHGHSRSCGCKRLEMLAESKLRHGHSNSKIRGGKVSPEYSSYSAAKQRCKNPKHEKYPSYGKRGIKFLFKSFEEFYAAAGPRPSLRHSIDRYPDNGGNYEVGNVRWATPRQQSANRSLTRFLVVGGRRGTFKEWSQWSGVPYQTLISRKHMGRCDACIVNAKSQAKNACSHK